MQTHVYTVWLAPIARHPLTPTVPLRFGHALLIAFVTGARHKNFSVGGEVGIGEYI